MHNRLFIFRAVYQGAKFCRKVIRKQRTQFSAPPFIKKFLPVKPFSNCWLLYFLPGEIPHSFLWGVGWADDGETEQKNENPGLPDDKFSNQKKIG
jgi:hypothetical protein